MVAAIAVWFWYSTNIAQQRAFAQYLVAKGQTIANDQPLLGVRLALEGLARLPQDDPAHTDLLSTTVELVR